MSHRPPDAAALHLAKVVESSDDAIVSKDLNSIITSWNRAAERIFGYTAAEAVGQSIRMVIPPDRQREEDEVLARIRRGESVTHFETWRMRKDGSLVPISLTISPILEADGTVIGASKIARDITEQVQLREQAARHAGNTQVLADFGAELAAGLDQDVIVQKVTDTATQLTGAQFGAFFYNVRTNDLGDAYML